MEREKLLINDEIREIVGATLGISAALFVMAYLESGSVASGICWRIIRKLGIVGIGIAVTQLVDKCSQEVIDENNEVIMYYSNTFKDVSKK